jgi:hypothetical protein|tara:strand:+ start:928 stop:1374 length:447 start_codon:yes stop_codon:yes gene_type:complete
MSTFQRKLQKDRTNEETSNAGLKWETTDDTYLLDSSKNGISITDIAKHLKRTEGSIKTRLVINILNNCNENKAELEELCTLHNISSKEVANYEQKKEQREKKKVTRPNEKSSGFPSTDLLEVYEGLSQLNKKIDTILDNQCTILKKIK